MTYLIHCSAQSAMSTLAWERWVVMMPRAPHSPLVSMLTWRTWCSRVRWVSKLLPLREAAGTLQLVTRVTIVLY